MKERWSDRHARPSGCAWVLLTGFAGLFAAAWPVVEAIR